MGLMDRMKAQATQLAKGAQEAGKVGQAKLEALQAKRKADALLTELGRITYEAQKGTGSPGDDAKRADIVGQLQQYEAEYGPIGAEHDHDAQAASDQGAGGQGAPAWGQSGQSGSSGQPGASSPSGSDDNPGSAVPGQGDETSPAPAWSPPGGAQAPQAQAADSSQPWSNQSWTPPSSGSAEQAPADGGS